MGPLREVLSLLPWSAGFEGWGTSEKRRFGQVALWTAPVPGLFRKPLPGDADGAYVVLNALLDAADAQLLGRRFLFGGYKRLLGRGVKRLFGRVVSAMSSLPPEYDTLMENMGASGFILINARRDTGLSEFGAGIERILESNKGLVPTAFWLADMVSIHLDIAGSDMVRAYSRPTLLLHCRHSGGKRLLHVGDMAVSSTRREVVEALLPTMTPKALRRCYALNDEGVVVPSDERRICRMVRMFLA